MKYKDLTPGQLRKAAEMIDDSLDAMRSEREELIEHHGMDIVPLMRCVVRKLEREATRREGGTG